MQHNYYGSMPQRTTYGYSGNGPKKGSNMNIVMAGAGGLAVGAALGVGGYMAYNAMKDSKRMSGTAFDQSWCQRPGGSGTVMMCTECFKVYGSRCTSENKCYARVGCDFKMRKNMARDDIMSVGFEPAYYTPPLTITITKLTGPSFLKSSICPKDSSSGSTFDDKWAQAESTDVNLFVTLTQVERLGSAGTGTGSVGQTSGAFHSVAPLGPVFWFGLLALYRYIHNLF